MKIAVITDDEKTVSRHFGRARYYLVFDIEDGKVVTREQRDKAGHQQFASEPHDHDHDHGHDHGEGHGMGPQAQHRHGQMIAPITDCLALVAGGMGRGAYISLEQAGIAPIVTDMEDAEAAALACAAGTITNHIERLH